MAQKPTTATQVSGYRFLVRRLEHSLVLGDGRMVHDPLRSHSRAVMVGIVFAILGTAVAAIMSFLKPAPDISKSVILIGKDSGAMYVKVNGAVHPVHNLTSARLAAGEPAKPAIVRDEDIADTNRGPTIGIPGAPSSIPPADFAGDSEIAWTVCDEVARSDGDIDSVQRTTLIAQRRTQLPPLEPGSAVLGSADGQGWLLYGPGRARIDLENSTVLAAFGLEGASPRPLSSAILAATPEMPPILAPVIPGAGDDVSYELPNIKVGEVFTVRAAEAELWFVALEDGIQQIGPAIADLVRGSDSVGKTDIARISPDEVSVPRVSSLPVVGYPTKKPFLPDSTDAPFLCASWHSEVSRPIGSSLIATGPNLPVGSGRGPVDLVGADGGGPRLDRVDIHQGGLHVVSTGVESGAVRRSLASVLLIDAGTRFEVPSPEIAAIVGLPNPAVPVPHSILDLLPTGPALTRPAALVERDAVVLSND